MSETNCIFCGIVARRAPAHIVDENERALALLDINPLAAGHTLVISKRCVPWWHDLDEDEIVSLFTLAHRVAKRMGSAFDPDFVCLYARGRRIPHTHIVLVPSRAGDVLDGVFNALERFQESPPALAALRDPAALAAAAERMKS